MGTLVSLYVVNVLVTGTRDIKLSSHKARSTATHPTQSATSVTPTTGAKANPALPGAKTTRPKKTGPGVIEEAASNVPEWVLFLVLLLDYWGVVFFVLQLFWTLAVLRLDFEMRWYMVTDRSLRLRSGLLVVKESTLSFVNIQQVVVTQGPIQRLLGLADVRVQSAGGGDSDSHGKGGGEELHTVVFHAVDNADEIRDVVLARLKQFRAASLGDPDDQAHALPVIAPAGNQSADTLAAAQELLAAARELRAAL